MAHDPDRTQLPYVLGDTTTLAASVGDDRIGAVWRLDAPERDLDSNVIALPPGRSIDAHDGPDLDVLIHVLAGSGRLITGADEIALTPGILLWMPRRSRREFIAGDDGLRYLTVHQRPRSGPLGIGRAGTV